jgi:hypothetical protein
MVRISDACSTHVRVMSDEYTCECGVTVRMSLIGAACVRGGVKVKNDAHYPRNLYAPLFSIHFQPGVRRCSISQPSKIFNFPEGHLRIQQRSLDH